MKPTTEILENINRNSLRNPNEVFTRVYRYMLREDLYYVAYKNLYANNGASTKGVDEDTADGFGPEKIQNIIRHLKNGTYQAKPARRVYVPKANGKMRPISIPTFTDKLVQEVMRMILEAIYEPLFLDCSHGFRPKRSCHTALNQAKRVFTGTRWFIEGDIKGCFDNINHQVLAKFVNQKIKDARFIELLCNFLKAGYLEDWRYNKTYSGTPQGGIISPILANIYLHKLDRYVSELQEQFAYKPERYFNPEYSRLTYELRKITRRLDKASDAEKPVLLKRKRELRKQMSSTPCKAQTDKKITYIRYADDFLVGVNGDHCDCLEIKRKLTEFVSEALRMELCAEKTLVTHSSEQVRFLGFDIRVRRNDQRKKAKNGRVFRTMSNKVELNIPVTDKIEKFLFSHGVVKQQNGKLIPCHRKSLLRLTDLEVLNSYNSEIRGICNYYNIASNYNVLHYFCFLMEYSCLKTLASKHKNCVKKVIEHFRDTKGWSIPYATKSGQKRMRIVKERDCLHNAECSDTIPNVTILYLHSRNTFESRLKAHFCELCGDSQSDYYEVHHVNKVKNLVGKEQWEQIMIAKRRKTLVVCRECHKRIHGKKID